MLPIGILRRNLGGDFKRQTQMGGLCRRQSRSPSPGIDPVTRPAERKVAWNAVQRGLCQRYRVESYPTPLKVTQAFLTPPGRPVRPDRFWLTFPKAHIRNSRTPVPPIGVGDVISCRAGFASPYDGTRGRHSMAQHGAIDGTGWRKGCDGMAQGGIGWRYGAIW